MGDKRVGAFDSLVFWLLFAVASLTFAARLGSSLTTNGGDAFYMVASGRWMLEHGTVQYENFASAIPGRVIVVQNWLFCVFAALCLNLSELLGINWWGMGLAATFMALALVAFGVRMASQRTDCSQRTIVALFTVAMLGSIYSLPQFRSHALTSILLIATLVIMRDYADGGPRVATVAVVGIAMLHANVQAALSPIIPMVVFAYAVEVSVRKRKVDWWGIALAAVSVIALLVNPYGVRGVLYGMVGGNAIGYGGYILEMANVITSLRRGVGMLGFVQLVFVVMLVLTSLRGQTRTRHWHLMETLFTVASIAGCALCVRNQALMVVFAWWLAIVGWEELVCGVRGDDAPEGGPVFNVAGRAWQSMATYAVLTVLCLILTARVSEIAQPLLRGFHAEPSGTGLVINEIGHPIECGRFIEEDWGVGRTEVPTILTLDEGSYFEYLGFRVSMSTRGECFEPEISGIDAHSFRDCADGFMGGNEDALLREMARTHYDYAVVRMMAGQVNVCKDMDEWELAFIGDEFEENGRSLLGYAVYRNVCDDA